MSLKGSFSLYTSARLHGGVVWQFVLKNTNMLFGETADVMICDRFGQTPRLYRNLKLKAGQAIAFNIDTIDWGWCQDDFAALVDSNNKIVKKWPFHIKEYQPGECPECHGSHKCKYCNGQGRIFPTGELWNSTMCTHCGGTGVCMTCNIDRRKPIAGMGPTGLKPF